MLGDALNGNLVFNLSVVFQDVIAPAFQADGGHGMFFVLGHQHALVRVPVAGNAVNVCGVVFF